jgi:hypothetical protein
MDLPGGIRLCGLDRLGSTADQPQERAVEPFYRIFERQAGSPTTPDEAVEEG